MVYWFHCLRPEKRQSLKAAGMCGEETAGFMATRKQGVRKDP
jgi:hypothetical protein